MKSNLETGLALGMLAMLIALPAPGEPNPDKDAFYGESLIPCSIQRIPSAVLPEALRAQPR